MTRRIRNSIAVCSASILAAVAIASFAPTHLHPLLRRRLLELDLSQVAQSERHQTNQGRYGESMPLRQHKVDFGSFLTDQYAPEPQTKTFNLPENQWCKPSVLPPLPYKACDVAGMINGVPLYGGLTNGLKFIILSAIKSFENGNQCFFIEERHDGPFPTQFGPFLDLFFEPIGLSPNSEPLQKGIKENRIVPLPWRKVWDDLFVRRVQDTVHDVPALDYIAAEGHDLKRNMLQRLWRPLPAVRDAACSTLESHLQGKEEYIALSIRQGDKTIEGFGFATMDQYIEKIEEVVPTQFGGKVPVVFVATDACAPVTSLRSLRPEWTFVSECDRVVQHGYDVNDNKKWNRQELTEHYSKFFVELFAMAGAKTWIGVSYSNVSWFVYFMRTKQGAENNFHILETEGADMAVPWSW